MQQHIRRLSGIYRCRESWRCGGRVGAWAQAAVGWSFAPCCWKHVPDFSAVTAAKEEGLNEQLSVLAVVVKAHIEWNQCAPTIICRKNGAGMSRIHHELASLFRSWNVAIVKKGSISWHMAQHASLGWQPSHGGRFSLTRPNQQHNAAPPSECADWPVLCVPVRLSAAPPTVQRHAH